MKALTTILEVRTALSHARRSGESVGLVPTMGYLHDGHMALVERAKRENDRVVVSIFVNPTQFGPNEDLSAYPRDLDRDLKLLERAGVDVAFAPGVEEIYPEPLQTSIDVEPLGSILIGRLRPGHFRGVATVCTKLFNIVQPDRAYFGEKDYQQLVLIKRMVRDLSMPIEIVGVATVREPDGLAASSRNVRLTPEDRTAATVVASALASAEAMVQTGERDPNAIIEAVWAEIDAEPRSTVQSVDIRDAETLGAVETIGAAPAVVLVNAKFGDVLLIDQREISRPAKPSAMTIET